MNLSSISPDWPSLPFSEWEATCDTLHMWTQIVGKTRMALTPAVNHWWHVPLYVTPRGLTTTSVAFGDSAFDTEFDFVGHRVVLRTADVREQTISLYPRSVADFYREYMAAVRALGVEVKIYRRPVEFDDTTPFDEDQHHASYDKEYVERFHRALLHADRVLKQFRTAYLGKVSPVHFFWGSFDLAVTRFSGRPAAVAAGADPVTSEAYSHEVSSCGFWPGDRRLKHPAFYSYMAPAPANLAAEKIRPAAAYWDTQLGEFILKYEDARVASSPDQDVLDFCESTYEAGANLARWDRKTLERLKPPFV
jgi:hypothetical protein